MKNYHLPAFKHLNKTISHGTLCLITALEPHSNLILIVTYFKFKPGLKYFPIIHGTYYLESTLALFYPAMYASYNRYNHSLHDLTS